MAKRVYQIGSTESILISEPYQDKTLRYTVDAEEINEYLDYVMEFLRTGRHLLTSAKAARLDIKFEYRKERLCWSIIRICTGLYPVPVVQEEFHSVFRKAFSNYGWGELRSDMWEVAYMKMPRSFKPRFKKGKEYTDYMPFFLRMFPNYISQSLIKIRNTYQEYCPIPGDLAVELNDDYIEEAPDVTREEILHNLITMNQCPSDPVQNMYYYMHDIGHKDASYAGFGRVLGYKDLDAAGFKRTACLLSPSHSEE